MFPAYFDVAVNEASPVQVLQPTHELRQDHPRFVFDKSGIRRVETLGQVVEQVATAHQVQDKKNLAGRLEGRLAGV